MATVTYITGSSLKLNRVLGQKISDLVNLSSKSANESANAYDIGGLERTFESYTPEQVWNKVSPLIESFFAFHDDQLIGVAFLSAKNCDDMPQGSGAYGEGLYVHPDYWGTDVARNLLYSTIDYAKESGFSVIRTTATMYPRTIQFFESHGFEQKEEIFWEALPGIKIRYCRMELCITDGDSMDADSHP